jgi:hypothetical protein
MFSKAASSTAMSDGTIRGAITDSSDGALPGVTVTATSLDGGVLATAVTDGTGAYELQALSAGQVRLSFQLDGFAAADALVTIEAAVFVVRNRLELAAVAETVVVVGRARRLSRTRRSRLCPAIATRSADPQSQARRRSFTIRARRLRSRALLDGG